MALPYWTWMLSDPVTLANIGELSTAGGRRITYKRNAYSEAACAISHEDDIAALLWYTIRTSGMPVMTAYRNGVERFRGYLAPFQEDAEETSIMSLVFRSPFGRLVGDGPSAGRFLYPGAGVNSAAEPLVYTAQDAGAIAYALLAVANLNSATGLAAGSAELSMTRDRTYDSGQNIGEAITNLSNVLDGFDFVERFGVEYSPMAYLDIYASLGALQTNARFEYGATTMNNVRSLHRTVTPPANLIYVQGGSGMYSVYRDTTSIAQYGEWPLKDSRLDITQQATLDARAVALSRPSPSRTVQLAPDPLLAPRPWDDYGLGDTVNIYARRGALLEDTTARINAFTVAIDEEGLETFETPDPMLPDEEATIRSSLVTEVAVDV